MFILSGRINEKLAILIAIFEKIIAIFEMQRVGEEERLVHFNFMPLCTFWILNHIYVLFLF